MQVQIRCLPIGIFLINEYVCAVCYFGREEQNGAFTSFDEMYEGH
jgi:hypothetical protein